MKVTPMTQFMKRNQDDDSESCDKNSAKLEKLELEKQLWK